MIPFVASAVIAAIVSAPSEDDGRFSLVSEATLARFEQMLGVRVHRRPLGSGLWGHAFLTEDGRVLKVTTSAGERALYDRVLPLVPELFPAVQAIVNAPQARMSAILREDLRPVVAPNDYSCDSHVRALGMNPEPLPREALFQRLPDPDAQARAITLHRPYPMRTAWEWALLLGYQKDPAANEEITRWLLLAGDGAPAQTRDFLRRLRRAILKLRGSGVLLDFHAQNLGVTSEDRIVLFDGELDPAP